MAQARQPIDEIGEELISNVTYPFEGVEFDCMAQTGADWYRLMLSSALGGKTVHGFNPTPSCEMISKVNENFAERYTSGRIWFNPAEKEVPTLGTDITDRPYVHKDFKGICSGTGAFFSFDQGMWEPSSRKRAREASILAATIASHTNDKKGACQIVEKITSDEVSEEAVDVAIIPVSHLKRDVIAVSKRAHRVFSCGSIQRAITWDDSQLAGEKLPDTSALDWGRVIAIARTLAEGNLQIDPAFAEYAQLKGVPFSLVKGCYAYVSYADYVFDPKAFENIPKVDLEQYMIPSLSKAYCHAAESIMKQCYVNLSRLSYEETSSSAAKIMQIVKECKLRVGRGAPKKSGWVETDVLAGPQAHSLNAHDAARISAKQATAHNALKVAITHKIHESANLLRLARIFAISRQNRRQDNHTLDLISKDVLRQDVWLSADALLADWLKNKTTARLRMASLKRSIFGVSGPLEAVVGLNARTLSMARNDMGRIVADAVITPAPKVEVVKSLQSIRQTQGATTMQTVARNVLAHFDVYRKAWVSRYNDWASAYSNIHTTTGKRKVAEYHAAATAFKRITPATVLAIEARFIDVLAPRKSYLYALAVTYAKIKRFGKIMLPTTVYKNATELAVALDKLLKPEITFVSLERFCYSKLVMFAGDFGVDDSQQNAAAVDEEENTAEYASIAQAGPSDSRGKKRKVVEEEVRNISGTRVVIAAEEGAVTNIDDMAYLFDEEPPVIVACSIGRVLSSYDNVTMAERHAKANGYRSFEAAYEALGDGARCDPANEYTVIAREAERVEKEKTDDGRVLA